MSNFAMKLGELFSNVVLLSGLLAWAIAQSLKVPLKYRTTRQWDWALLLRAGGMPSSHSALVAAVAHATGLKVGFGSPLFALALTFAIIVIYDAAGIRRQAGRHAKVINAIIHDLASGHPLKGEKLLEVLGHTPLEAFAGAVLGVVIAQAVWFLENSG
jgi:acid phosphatase family membrane protein YuiD